MIHLFSLFVGLTNILIEIYTLVLIATVILSWVNADPQNPLVSFLWKITYPVLNKVRYYLPESIKNLRVDISPIIVIVGLILVKGILNSLLYQLQLK